MIYQSLENNGYLTNNEIWMDLYLAYEFGVATYFKVSLVDYSNSKDSGQFILYTKGSSGGVRASINLQPIVKSMMSVPDGEYYNNSFTFEIRIETDNSYSLNVFKSFIRGGVRTNDINKSLTPNQGLRVASTVPVWSGYPVFDYRINAYYIIEQIAQASISDIDNRRTKGCNNIYVKFLNQNGGYSFWLFESFIKRESNVNLGYSVNTSVNKLVDLGNESKNNVSVYSKIPKNYLRYAQDLIISPDIYIYTPEESNVWTKVFSKNNSVEFDNIKKVYSVFLNLEFQYRFNPSLLWTN